MSLMKINVSSLIFIFSSSFLLSYQNLRRTIFGQNKLKSLINNSVGSGQVNSENNDLNAILDSKAKLISLDKTKYHMYVFNALSSNDTN
jgi:uncharacterized protein YpmS